MKCEKLIKTAAVVALILFIAGAVIGTLAVPVVLSMFYSWYWLFLYKPHQHAVICSHPMVYRERVLDGWHTVAAFRNGEEVKI